MLQTELRALHGTDSLTANGELHDTDSVIDSLTENMQKLLIESRLRTHPAIRPVWDRVVNNAKMRSVPPIAVKHHLETSDSTIVPVDDAPIIPSVSSRMPSPSKHASRLSPIVFRGLSPPSDLDNGALSDSGTVASSHSTHIDRMSSSPPPPNRKGIVSRSPSPSPPRSPNFRRINAADAASGAVGSPGVKLFQSNFGFTHGTDSIE
jgi:hypothetical protein